jgi:peptidoglycan glycosyltransferase
MAIYEGSNRNGRGGPAMRRGNGSGIKAPPHMLRNVRTTSNKPRRGILLAILLSSLAVALLVPTVALGAGVVFYNNTAASLRPRLDQLASYHERAFQTSRIFDRNGTLLYELVNAGRRDPVKLNQIADVLKEATISVEDKTFYENVGVDYVGIARAAYQNIVSGQEVSGASTITQQLIKLVILSDEERQNENRYRRKLSEIVLAQQISEQLSKDEILELYLNEINYGNLAYGIQAAAKTYFNTDASKLNLNQASLLAGIPQSPTTHNPIPYLKDGYLPGVRLKPTWMNPEARLPYGITPPRARQVVVLRQMVSNGKITRRAAEAAVAEDLQFVREDIPFNAPHFVFYVKQLLQADPTLGPVLANEGGLNITTTLDLRIQNIAQTEAARRIDELEKENRNIHNAAVVVQQPGTGQILAMVGSIDYNKSKASTTPGETANVLDGKVNVTTAERQPGSALKPFTYLSAMEQKKVDPGSVLWDIETKFPIKQGASKKNLKDPEFWYGPKNYDQKWHGPLRMRESLANSLNMPAVKALKYGGVPQMIDLAHRAGIPPTSLNQPPEYYGLSLTLGGGAVTPLDLTTVYNTLANNGEYIPATPILKVTDRSGKEIQYNAGERRQAIDPKYVAIVRDFMGDNEARTPMFGRNNPLNPSRPAHAKTGTTEDFRDAWALGYTPYVTVGVWTGNNNNEKTAKVESTVGGGVIWNRIMEDLFKDPELDRFLRGPDLAVPLDFPSPKTFGVEERDVCSLGTRFSKRTKEWFVPNERAENRGAPSTGVDCDLTRTIKVVADPNGGYCQPAPGVNYGGRLITIKVSSLPPSTDEEMIVDPKWEGGTASTGGAGQAPDHVCGTKAPPRAAPRRLGLCTAVVQFPVIRQPANMRPRTIEQWRYVAWQKASQKRQSQRRPDTPKGKPDGARHGGWIRKISGEGKENTAEMDASIHAVGTRPTLRIGDKRPHLLIQLVVEFRSYVSAQRRAGN